MVLRLRITAPSIPQKYIDVEIYIYIYLNALVCLRMRVYTYICIFTFRLGVDSGTQPVSAKKKKEKKIPELGPSINNETPCPRPTPRAPLQKKRETLFFLRGKIKMLPSHLLILLHARFCSPFN